MKKNLVPVLVVLLLIFVVGVAGVVTHLIRKYTPTKEVMNPAEYYGETTENEIPVMIDAQLLEERGLLKNGEAYLSIAVVDSMLNQKFYWDQEAQKLLYTDTEETLEQDADDGENPMVMLQNDTIYINLRYVAEHTDIEFSLFTDPDRLVIQKTWTGFQVVETTKNASVRYQGGIKSPILTSASAGTTLRLIEELENWLQVATPDGYIGYLERDTVGDPTTFDEPRSFPEEAFRQISLDAPVNLAWHQVTSMDANETLEETVQEISGVNVISPTWFTLTDNEGGVASIASADYVNKAHAMGMDVWGLVDNFKEEVNTAEVLAKMSARKNIVDTLVREAVSYGMDGINIDFETLSEEAGPHFLQFLRELSVETHKAGLVLSVDNPVPEDFTSHYDRKEQSRVVDYVIIMGYDEHYAGSEEPGSVASLPWVEQGIQDTLAEVPAEKTINGIPFYTRIWKTSAGVTTSEAVGMDTASNFITENKIETYWDKNTSQNYGAVDIGNDTYQIWLEDEDSIQEKVLLTSKYQLAGVAFWKLGFERPAVWKVISENLTGDSTEE